MTVDATGLREATKPIIAGGHPLPDLTGESAEVIINALTSTLVVAHRDDPIQEGADWSCPPCAATIDLASRFGNPTHMEWPDPVRQHMAVTIHAEPAARKG